MENSLVYRIYDAIRNIYINSKIVIAISRFISFIFNVLVNSKIYLWLSSRFSRQIFKNSRIYGAGKGFADVIGKVADKHRGYIDNSMKDSFFISSLNELSSDESKRTVKYIIMFFIFTLVFNMLIKMLMGNFSIIGNRNFIALTVAFLIMYLIGY